MFAGVCCRGQGLQSDSASNRTNTQANLELTKSAAIPTNSLPPKVKFANLEPYRSVIAQMLAEASGTKGTNAQQGLPIATSVEADDAGEITSSDLSEIAELYSLCNQGVLATFGLQGWIA